MSYDRTVDPAGRLIRVTIRGDADLPSSLKEIEATANDLTANPGFGLVIDIRGSTNLPTLDEVRAIVDAVMTRSHAFAAGIAFVVAGVVQFGVGRMVSIFGELRGLRINVFRSVDEAEEWLGGGSGSRGVRGE